MNMNTIGKFEMRAIVNEFDATLIRLYGVNMLDAEISHYEALGAYNEFHGPQKAAEITAYRHGLCADNRLQLDQRPLQVSEQTSTRRAS